MSPVIKSVLHGLSPAGPRARLTVMIFHRVLPRPDPLFPDEIDAARFDRICAWVRDWFNVVPLDEAVRRLDEGTLPARALAITFDDGYADNRAVALPILSRHGLTATFFIATGFLDGGRMWNDTIIESIRRTAASRLNLGDLEGFDCDSCAVGSLSEKKLAIASLIGHAKYRKPESREMLARAVARCASAILPDDLMMTSADVMALRTSGMQIGAHTVTHPILSGLPRELVQQEMAQSKAFLENLLGERVGLFAYPNGNPDKDLTAETVAIATTVGFDAAVTTAWGSAGQMTHRMQIPRFTPWDRSRLRFGARMVANLLSEKRSEPAAQGA